MRQKLKAVVVCTVMTFTLTGQPDEGTPETPAPFGALEILIGAGALLGGKKACERYKNKK